jgi:Uma2 family endonuclease
MSTATATRTDGDRFVLSNVSWERYTALRDDPTQLRVRMTYFHGVLELMSPSGPHERISRILEKLVSIWCEVHELPILEFGSTTYRREDRSAGLEPDSCLYIQSVSLIGAKEDLELAIDPPPDLAIEVDIASSSVGCLPVYAAFGVPEVWRTNGDWLRVYRLVSGRYEEVAESDALRDLPLADLVEFIRRRAESNSLDYIHEFRAWATAQKPSA